MCNLPACIFAKQGSVMLMLFVSFVFSGNEGESLFVKDFYRDFPTTSFK